MIGDGYHDLPPGKLANVVTCLEMSSPPAERFASRDDATIVAVRPGVDSYRNAFRRIGAAWSMKPRSDREIRSFPVTLYSPEGEMTGTVSPDCRQIRWSNDGHINTKLPDD